MLFKSLHRNIKIRLFVGFLFGIAQSTTMPFMAIYFAHSVGEAITGLLLTLATIASLAAGMIGGYYCDKFGRRRIMILGESVFLVTYAVMAAANSPWWQSPWVTFAAFLIGNICWGVYGPADEAMLLDITTPENRPAVYGMFYWMFNLTMAIGSSAGAFMFESHRLLLFELTGATLFITLMTTIFGIAETYPGRHSKHSSSDPAQSSDESTGSKHPSFLHVYRRVFRDTTFVLYLIGGVLVATLEFGLNNYIGIHLSKDMAAKNIHLFHQISVHVDGIKMVGLLQTENTILVVLLATAAVRFITNRSKERVLLWGLIFNVSGFIMMTVLTVPFALLAAMVLATVGEIVNVPVRQAYMGDMAPEDMRSAYAAMNGMTYGSARMMASLAVILGAIVPNWTMGVILGLSGAAGILLIRHVSVVLRAGAGSTVGSTPGEAAGGQV